MRVAVIVGQVAGLCLVAVGAGMVHAAAGVIVAGSALFGVAWSLGGDS